MYLTSLFKPVSLLLTFDSGSSSGEARSIAKMLRWK